MIYLVQFEAYDQAKSSVVLERFATDGYTTGKNDDPPHVHFEERVVNPGTYEQTVFDNGTTSGEARVGYGYVEIAIGDDGAGNNADRLASHAVDGRPITIWALEDVSSPWSSRALVFSGLMEQIEVSWTLATIRIMDRLDDLREPIQPTMYLGTTTDGTKTDAEGTRDDLKDRPKPLAWGVNRNVPGILSNRFKLIVDFAANGCEFLEVRDKGVALTKGTGYATFASLMAATVPERTYAFCTTTGQLKLGSPPAGAISADITEGASGQRSAARVARRILEKAGFVADTDFSTADLNALHSLNSADLGVWVGSDPLNVLPLLTRILDSVGGYVVPDAAGLLHFGRVSIPAASSTYPVIDRTMILDSGSARLERVATSDDRNGVPAWKVTIRYAPSWLTQSETELDQTAATAATKAFVSKEMRTASAENAAVKAINLKAAELTFDTLLADEADALAEAQRRLAIYSAPRERYRVPVKAEVAEGITLGSAVTLKLPRFGLAAGKPMLVIGLDTRLPRRQGGGTSAGIVILDLYG